MTPAERRAVLADAETASREELEAASDIWNSLAKENATMKIHVWLMSIDSHGIYDHRKLTAEFKDKTGLEPCWPAHRIGDLRREDGSFKGPGFIDGRNTEEVAYGWEIAGALEDRYAKTQSFRSFLGRGSRYRASLQSLRERDL